MSETQAAPAPRFGATVPPTPRRPREADAALLRDWGLDPALAEELSRSGD